MTDLFKFGDHVTWTTPMFGITRYGYFIATLPDGNVRVEFGNDGMEIRDLPPESIQKGWVRPAN